MFFRPRFTRGLLFIVVYVAGLVVLFEIANIFILCRAALIRTKMYLLCLHLCWQLLVSQYRALVPLIIIYE